MIPVFPKIDKTDKTIEGVSIKALADEHGSPLLIFSERVILEKYKKLRNSLDRYYPNSQIAYSVKTNYLPGIIASLKKTGAWAEVVSGFEYWLAKKLGFAGNQIIFNGPDKKTDDIEQALKDGVRINVDNLNEIERLVAAAKKFEPPVKIGLRVNYNIGASKWDRFGFNLDNGEAAIIADKIKNEWPHLEISGLHIHMGTNLNDISYYTKAAEKLADFADFLEKKLEFSIEYLDFGGGLAVPGSRWLNSPIWVVPEAEEYIKSIAEVLNKRLEKKPKIFFEPGRYLVDEAGIFLTTILNSKELHLDSTPNTAIGTLMQKLKNSEHRPQLLNVDSSAFSFLKSAFIRHKLAECIKLGDEETKENEISTFIAGNSCIGQDFLGWNMSLPKMEAGDLVIFYNAGAYTISVSEQFIHPRPAVVMIEENGNVKCIRKKESYENMIALDNFG